MTVVQAIPHPAAHEYAPFYAGYVASVSGRDLADLLERQVAALRDACATLSKADADHRYAPGKWSIKQVLGHLGDAERVFSYRILRISRGDDTPLPGFEENAYVAAADFDSRPIADLVEELELIRASTLALLRHLPPDAWERKGTASGAEVSTRALVAIIAGHMQHHIGILTDRYGLRIASI